MSSHKPSASSPDFARQFTGTGPVYLGAGIVATVRYIIIITQTRSLGVSSLCGYLTVLSGQRDLSTNNLVLVCENGCRVPVQAVSGDRAKGMYALVIDNFPG
jgi:hypothetical protein